jgi:hypothetical protein
MWQDVCTTDQLTAFYAACIDPATAGLATCQAFSQSDAANAACAACVVTPESASNYGPLIDQGSLITENVGGCIELTDPNGLPCAKSQQALGGCELAACEANCPVHDDTSALDECTAAAAMAGCEMFADQASCVLDIAEAGTSTACVSATFRDFYDAVVPLFCGSPPPPEGGAPPPDGRASEDAASSNDGGAESSTDAAPSEGSTADGSPADAPVGDAAPDVSPE